MSISTRTNIILWLFSGCFLIFVMVIVGGITRLTGSGLSITKWDVVTGVLPPLSESKWQHEFALYSQTPQFKHINAHFGIEDFKSIYWWEYIHRLIGRLIGVVFIIPFFWFLYKKQLPKVLIFKCLFLFFMGGLQGFIGWYMVKSGLINIPSVSHFRLALHLFTAFMTFGFTFWFAFELIHTEKIKLSGWHKSLYRFSIVAFILTIIQIIYGAFVAGLKAGFIYNTWPLMGDTLIASSVNIGFQKEGWMAFLTDISGVQFVHRYLAYVVTFAVLFLAWFSLVKHKSDKLPLTAGQKQAVLFVVAVVLFQFALGVITLLMKVPVFMGVLHQVGAFFLFSTMIYLLHRLNRQPLVETIAR